MITDEKLIELGLIILYFAVGMVWGYKLAKRKYENGQ